MHANGTFEVEASFEPPYDAVDGVSLGRAHFSKRFVGSLEAASEVDMLATGTPVEGSSAYVALERVRGTLEGRTGTFVLLHRGLMTRGVPALSVTVVPDSGTGELAGLEGALAIEVVEGRHRYHFEYRLGA